MENGKAAKDVNDRNGHLLEGLVCKIYCIYDCTTIVRGTPKNFCLSGIYIQL